MSHDLRTLIQDSVDAVAEEHEATAPPVEQDAARLWARVTRRRALRSGGMVVGAAAALAAVAVAVSTVVAPPAPVPPASPEPTVVPTPTPTATASTEPRPTSSPAPSPDPSPAGEEAPGRHSLLPAAEPLDAAALARTDDSWHLVVYREPAALDDAVPATAFLVDPVGQLYEVPTRLPLQIPSDELGGATAAVHEWLPGTSLVRLLDVPPTGEAAGSHRFTVADLLTGEVLATFPADVRPRFVGDGTTDLVDLPATGGVVRYTATGEEVARTGPPPGDWDALAQPVLDPISPDRSTVVLFSPTGAHLYDARTLSPTGALPLPYAPDERYCWGTSWVNDSTIAVGCHEWTTTAEGYPTTRLGEWWLVRRDGEPVRVSEPDSGWGVIGSAQGFLVQVLVDGADGRDRWRAAAPDGSVREIPGAGVLGTMTDGDGAGRLVWATDPWGDDGPPVVVRAADPLTGQEAWALRSPRPTVVLDLVPSAAV